MVQAKVTRKVGTFLPSVSKEKTQRRHQEPAQDQGLERMGLLQGQLQSEIFTLLSYAPHFRLTGPTWWLGRYNAHPGIVLVGFPLLFQQFLFFGSEPLYFHQR